MDERVDCLLCIGGYVCDEWGFVRLNRLCGVGYFCREGVNITIFNFGDKVNICFVGYYCFEGMKFFVIFWFSFVFKDRK